MPEILSNEQIEAYRELGYLVLERHLPDDILIKIRAEISGITCTPEVDL